MNDHVYYSQEAKGRAQREQALSILVVLGLGLGFGALIALLFAPRSADRFRSEVNDAIEAAVDNGRKASQQTLEQLEQEVDELR